MAEFFRFVLLMIIDLLLSGIGACFLFQSLFEDVDTGTGAIGEAFAVWFVVIISFLIMLFTIGIVLYWLMFTLEINAWYFTIALVIGAAGFIIFLFRNKISTFF